MHFVFVTSDFLVWSGPIKTMSYLEIGQSILLDWRSDWNLCDTSHQYHQQSQAVCHGRSKVWYFPEVIGKQFVCVNASWFFHCKLDRLHWLHWFYFNPGRHAAGSNVIGWWAGRYWVRISVPAPTQRVFLKAQWVGVRSLCPLLSR